MPSGLDTKRSSRFGWLGLPLGIVVVLLFAGSSFAAVMLFVTTKQMTKDASHIVIGTVVGKEAFEINGQIFTRFTIKVQETLKGQVTNRTLQIIEEGGVLKSGLGGSTLGAPTYQVGEDIFAFLKPGEHGLQTSDLLQGRMFVQEGPDGEKYLTRPPSDMHKVTISDFDAQGRNKNFCLCQVLNLQPALKLDDLRKEVKDYHEAFERGEDPQLSVREQELLESMKDLIERCPLDPKQQVMEFHLPVQDRKSKYVLNRKPDATAQPTLWDAAKQGGQVPVPVAEGPLAAQPPANESPWYWHLFYLVPIVLLLLWELLLHRTDRRKHTAT